MKYHILLGKITEEGVFLEQLETDVSKYLPEVTEADVSGTSVDVDINMPMSELRSLLSQYPVTTRLNLTGTLVVARDQAHAKILERVDSGEGQHQSNLQCMKSTLYHIIHVTSCGMSLIRAVFPPTSPCYGLLCTPFLSSPRLTALFSVHRATSVPQGPHGLLCRTGQDSRWVRLRLFRTHDCRTYGCLSRRFHGGGGQLHLPGQGEQVGAGLRRRSVS